MGRWTGGLALLAMGVLGCRATTPDAPEAAGLYCFHPVPGYLDCANSEAECAESRKDAATFHIERGAAPAEIEALLDACHRAQPWCYVDGEGLLFCTDSAAECQASLEAGDAAGPCSQPTSVSP